MNADEKFPTKLQQDDSTDGDVGFFHIDDLASACQSEGFSDRDFERLSYALTRKAQENKDQTP